MTSQYKSMRYNIVVLSSLLVPLVTHAELTTGDVDAVNQRLQKSTEILKKMPEHRRKALSSGGLNLLKMAENWKKFELNRVTNSPALHSTRVTAAVTKALEFPMVSDPSSDVDYSSFTGFTQSETSTAWCGNSVVVGYNDTGSTSEQLEVSPSKSFSRAGYSHSSDGGKTFTDMKFLPSDPVPAGGGKFFDIGGDPVVACTDPNTFYFVTIAINSSGVFFGDSDIAISKSTDSGVTFGGPVVAASKSQSTHFLDKPWMTVDPNDKKRIYITYTDFDFSYSSTSCRDDDRTAIELVSSTDAGKTWSEPLVLAEKCGFSPFVQGSQVAVGPDGEVYVAWEDFIRSDNPLRTMRIRRSSDHGATFAPTVKIANVTCVGSCFLLQGGFRSAFEFPSLAVDTSTSSRRGHVYIAWHDGRNVSIDDEFSLSYRFADVLISRSTNGGKTWGAPIKVNSNDEPLDSGRGTDQYQPSIAVDNNGNIGVCYYDRKRDKANFFIDRTCAVSKNGGSKWVSQRMTQKAFLPLPGQDFGINPVYMGDYDSLATDATRAASGFIGAYANNSKGTPDVVISKQFE